MQLQTAMQQMQVHKCTTQLHSPLFLPLCKEGFLQLNCHVSLLSLCGHSVTYSTKLGVPLPGFFCSSIFFCDDVHWCSFFVGCFDILFLFDLFSFLWSFVLFWFLFMVWCFNGCQLMFSFCVSHFCAEMFFFVMKNIGWIICPLKRSQKILLICKLTRLDN